MNGLVAIPSPSTTTVLPDLGASRAWCRRVTRLRAGNFYHGLRLMPEPKRSDMYGLYAWMRVADDLADGGTGDPFAPDAEAPDRQAPVDRSAVEASLDAFREDTHRAFFAPEAGAYQSSPYLPLWPAMAELVNRYDLSPIEFDEMIAGQRLDLERQRYETFDQLYDYCRKVASSVGLICVAIWGEAQPPPGTGSVAGSTAEPDGEAQTTPLSRLAEYRGIAFQLTNILRDLVEDTRRSRVYLPSQELARFGVSIDPADANWPASVEPARFERLMRFQIERAMSYYDLASPLERRLAPDCRATSWAMNQIYYRLLKRLDANPRLVLRRRVSLPASEKLAIALRALTRRRW